MDKFEAALREHAWDGRCFCLSDYNCFAPACLGCGNHQGEGHERDCWLKALGIESGVEEEQK